MEKAIKKNFFNSHKRLTKPIRGSRTAIREARNNSPQRDKPKRIQPTRETRLADRAKREEWLKSEHGQQTIRDMRAANVISSNLIAKKYPSISDDDVRFYMAKADKLDEEMNLIINKVLSQMI